jgi:hypothetical protein
MPGHHDETPTPACARAAHEDCPHMTGMGGGFNPRRLRPEFGVDLCPCSCHEPCPVAIGDRRMTVPMKTWHASCTCPGAEPERQRVAEHGLEMRDFGEMTEEARRRSRARKEAYETARSRAAGQSRAEIREIYIAELTARGIKIPAEPVVDAIVERIRGNPLPAVRVAGESVVQMGKGLYHLSRLLRGGQ